MNDEGKKAIAIRFLALFESVTRFAIVYATIIVLTPVLKPYPILLIPALFVGLGAVMFITHPIRKLEGRYI
jgi:hypothetical protein